MVAQRPGTFGVLLPMRPPARGELPHSPLRQRPRIAQRDRLHGSRRDYPVLRGEVADEMRVTLEIGSKSKKVVAVAPDWPGLERGATTGETAIERLLAYLPRYARVASMAGMDAEFTDVPTTIDVAEQYPGNGSTDFWGISFAFSDIDRQDMSSEELARQLTLMQACWALFDEVRSRVSAEMQRGPRGGGRHRDRIVGHVVHTEQDWTK